MQYEKYIEHKFISAVSQNSLEAVKDILDEIKAATNEAFYRALVEGHEEIAEEILKSGVDVNYQDSSTKITPLMKAAREGRSDVVQKLIDLGADLNLKALTDFTALFFARRRGLLRSFARTGVFSCHILHPFSVSPAVCRWFDCKAPPYPDGSSVGARSDP